MNYAAHNKEHASFVKIIGAYYLYEVRLFVTEMTANRSSFLISLRRFITKRRSS